MKRGLCLSALCCLASCGPADPYGIGQTCPVDGQVYVDEKPLTLKAGCFGRVWFHPDAAKGNKCPQVAVGDLDDDGKFKLATRDQNGAPPGWYKVVVVATMEIDPSEPKKKRKSYVNAKYGSPATSKLAVQVMNNSAPDVYDLKLTK